MKFLKKVITTNCLLLGCTVVYTMGSDSFKYVPVVGEGGIVVFVPYSSKIIELKGPEIIHLNLGDTYRDFGIRTLDNNELSSFQIIGNVNIFKSGTYTIKYTATDSEGHKDEIERTVIVLPRDALLPRDTNLYYAPYNEKGYLYFADPQPDEHGENRVIRVNYKNMTFNENNDSIILTEDAYLIPGKTHSNPHSVDRAGKTNKFYVRTQNAYSFDVIEAKNGKLEYLKTVPLSTDINGTTVQYSPRAFGAYNAKYNIQLLSGRNADHYSVTAIINVENDEIIKTISTHINGKGSNVTGHAKWLNKDYFAVIDRGNHAIHVYKIFKNYEGRIDVLETDSIDTITPIHALERVENPKNIIDLNTFYTMGVASGTNGSNENPFIEKLIFDSNSGKFVPPPPCGGGKRIADFINTDYSGLAAKKIPAATHHASIIGDYIYVPVYDGKIYKINRDTMAIVGKVDTGIEKGLGAGHIVYSKSLNLLVITNHWSPYITLIDISNNQFKLKGYMKIYRDGDHDIFNPDEKHLMQPHFAQISDDGKYFYTFASQDNGRFVKVNLEELIKIEQNCDKIFEYDNDSNNSSVLKSIDVGGAPEQAHS